MIKRKRRGGGQTCILGKINKNSDIKRPTLRLCTWVKRKEVKRKRILLRKVKLNVDIKLRDAMLRLGYILVRK